MKDRVSDGRVDVGLMDEDDAVVALRDKKPVALVIPDQEGPDPLGAPLMPNAALLVRGAPHPVEAKAFIDFLTSAEAEQILAASAAAQYPLHPDATGPDLLPPLKELHVMQLDYADVARKLPAMGGSTRVIGQPVPSRHVRLPVVSLDRWAARDVIHHRPLLALKRASESRLRLPAGPEEGLPPQRTRTRTAVPVVGHTPEIRLLSIS